MRKTGIIIFVFILFLCGCSDEKSEEVVNAYTFTDDLDRLVTVESFERTAALLGSFADIWMLAGGEICASADDAWEDFNLEIPHDAVNLGDTEKINVEKLIASQPDFIIASTARKQHIEIMDILEASGIAVAYFDVSEFEDYLNMLKICTDITGRDDLYRKNGMDLKSEIEKTIYKSKARVAESGSQSILFLRASSNFIRAKSSHNTVLGEMLVDLGCINIADSNVGLLEDLSIESILQENPYRIFIVQSGDDFEGTKRAVRNMFDENPAWYSLDAVENDRVHFMDKHLYNFKPNAKWSEAYEQLEEILAN